MFEPCLRVDQRILHPKDQKKLANGYGGFSLEEQSVNFEDWGMSCFLEIRLGWSLQYVIHKGIDLAHPSEGLILTYFDYRLRIV
jgi:hypothetical protein